MSLWVARDLSWSQVVNSVGVARACVECGNVDVEVVKSTSCAIQQTLLNQYCCKTNHPALDVGYSEVCIVTIHQSLTSKHETLQRALRWISEWKACAEANLVPLALTMQRNVCQMLLEIYYGKHFENMRSRMSGEIQ